MRLKSQGLGLLNDFLNLQRLFIFSLLIVTHFSNEERAGKCKPNFLSLFRAIF